MTINTLLWTQDQSYPAWMLRQQMAAVYQPGVSLPGFDFKVTPASGLQVAVGGGNAMVQQTAGSGSESSNDFGLYYVSNNASVNPVNTIIAPVSHSRWDLVVLRVYDVFEQSLSGVSHAQVEWVTGTESASATLTNFTGIATAPNNSLILAQVLQTVGESSISSSNIINMHVAFNPITPGPWIAGTLASGWSASAGGGAFAREIENGNELEFFIDLDNSTGSTVSTSVTVVTFPSSVPASLPSFTVNSWITAGLITTAGVATLQYSGNTLILRGDWTPVPNNDHIAAYGFRVPLVWP